MDVKALLAWHRNRILGAAGAIVIYALLGFFLAPWLVKKNLIEGVRTSLAAELTVGKVAINPFVLSLELNALRLDDARGSPVLAVDRIFINFQLSSVFRRAWTFREFHIGAPVLSLSRDQDGEFNIAFLLAPAPGGETAAEAAVETEAGPPRILIADFAIRESAIDWRDTMLPEPVATRFGPVNIAIADLSTLPERAGRQDVVITTESAGTLGWSGSLQLNPLHSEGHASVQGSHFPLTSAYMKHEAGFDIVDGIADVELDYRVTTRADGTIEASIDNLDLYFRDVAVRTFNQAFGIAEADREVLRLPTLALTGGSLRWPEQSAAARSIAVDDAVMSLYRDTAGRFNVLPPAGQEAAEPETAVAEPEAAAPATAPWVLSLDEFRINRMALGLEDHSVDPVADIGYRSLDVLVQNISNQPGASFPTSVNLVARDAGTISLDGEFSVLPAPAFDVDLAVDGLALANAHPYLKPLADVNLDSGALNVSVAVTRSPGDSLHVEGDVEIVDFLITETDEGSRLGSWSSLLADHLVYSTADNALEISEIHFADPYGDILITADGSINLGRVQRGEENVDAGEEGGTVDDGSDDTASADAQDAPPETALPITIGRVVVSNGAADFADLSLPLPFRAQIAELNGELSTIATTSSEPSMVSLEGKVDEFGQVRISGTVTPLDLPANTDIRVAFQNVDMPKFSAYSIPFAGREISSGRLDLDLGYKVTAGQLAGENNIVLRDFELGDKVDHPGALSLPLGLAVALLKDPDGRINLDVPVRGDVNDPEFRYGGVAIKALVNLLTRIVTSPFALLANLVGAEASELEYLVFLPGRADLSPPEMEKAAKIAEALALRPQLVLQLRGAYDPGADGDALKSARVDDLIEARIESMDDGENAMYAERRGEVIEALYAEAGIAADPAAALAELRTANTIVDAEGAETFDALAYTEALRAALVDAQPVTEAQLLALGDTRAQSARTAILAVTPDLEPRVLIEAAEAAPEDDGGIRMQVQLSAGEDIERPPPQDAATDSTITFD